MFNLYDLSGTIDFGEVSSEAEAIMVLFENDHRAGIMSGFIDGELIEKRIDVSVKHINNAEYGKLA